MSKFNRLTTVPSCNIHFFPFSIDKFRKSQESKEDKTGGPDEAEINDLATNLQEASQGAPFIRWIVKCPKWSLQLKQIKVHTTFFGTKK